MSQLTQDLAYLKKTFQGDYKNKCTNWLVTKLKSPDPSFLPISPDLLRIGGFYFMQYDIGRVNKTSKLEQYSPIMLVDYRRDIDARVIYALNLNFLTTQKKEAFFVKFMEQYDAQLVAAAKQADWQREAPLPGINYERMMRELLPFAFEYGIREYRLELVNEVQAISMMHLAKLISINTQAVTGVDEAKLNDIWIAKLRNEGMVQRVLDMVEVKSNYEKILQELADKFKKLDSFLRL